VETRGEPSLISIILVSHDEERTLPAAFSSILEQTMDFRLLEILVVDDGSLDSCGEIGEAYARRYGNVRAIRFQEASGAAGRPRNAGMAAPERRTSCSWMATTPTRRAPARLCTRLSFPGGEM
jgi:glycosyltransferase involved in cell wall biosynthesis